MTLLRAVPTGNTRVVGLLGYPAKHSLSPVLHNAAYADMAFDATYVVFPTPPEQLASAVAAVRSLNLLGVSVTYPYKELVLALCDRVTDEASRLQAVNCIAFTNGELVGHNTDGAGFVNALKDELAFDPEAKRCMVLGAGGAARAVVAALASREAKEVIVVNRSFARGEDAMALAGAVGRLGDESDVANADLIVNATPLGMVGEFEGARPIKAGLFRRGQVVVDCIYRPQRTPFLDDAASCGAEVANGMGMLIHQAALQIELWTDRSPSIDVMRAAVVDA